MKRFKIWSTQTQYDIVGLLPKPKERKRVAFRSGPLRSCGSNALWDIRYISKKSKFADKARLNGRRESKDLAELVPLLKEEASSSIC